MSQEIVWSMPFALSKSDIKKWLINTLKYFAGIAFMAALAYMKQLLDSGSVSISINDLIMAVYAALSTSVIDVVHRYLNDNTKPL